MKETSQAKLRPPGEYRAGQAKRAGKSRLALIGLCLYWPAIFVLSHIPKALVPPGISVSGITLHVVAYVVLTLLVFMNAGSLGRVSLREMKTYLLVGAIVVYAAIDEWLQLYIQGRDGNPFDWSIDVAACVGCLVVLILINRRRSARGAQFTK